MKTANPASNKIITGIYMYDHQVFDMIRQCKPSARGELEISDVNNMYVKNNNCAYTMLDGWWSDAGTLESLTHAAKLVRDKGVDE